MSNKDLSPAEQSLLKKGPSFEPTSTDINWWSLRCHFDSLVNKLRHRVSKPVETSSIYEPHLKNISNSSFLQLDNSSNFKKSSNLNFRKEKTNVSSLETFIGLLGKDLFEPSNYNKIKGNITTEERKALKSIQSNELRSYQLQDKGSLFLFLDNQDYIEKINYLFCSFEEFDHDHYSQRK